jgi:hypothetical protein
MAEILQTVVKAFWVDGGQRTSRRNAWAAMVADAKRARERAEVDAVLIAVGAVREAPRAAAVSSHG